MKTVVGIQFKGGGRVYYFDPLDLEFQYNDYVIVETVRGLELGHVLIGNRLVEDDDLEHDLKPVIRKATQEDLTKEKNNNELAKKSFEIFKHYVKIFNLEMKPLYCEYTIDSSKVIFYYSAEDRVDFRDLLKVLAPEFKIRVELRQIGTREAARIMGGIGSCGREICCKKHLTNFDFVTMKMAKEQGMALNTNKISGICDKLMCCIAYEHELYKELKKELPSVGQMVKTPSCECCKIVSVDYLKRTVKTDENPGGTPVLHKADDVEIITLNSNVKDDATLVASIDTDDNIVVEEVNVESIIKEKENKKTITPAKDPKHFNKKTGNKNAKTPKRNN